MELNIHTRAIFSSDGVVEYGRHKQRFIRYLVNTARCQGWGIQ